MAFQSHGKYVAEREDKAGKTVAKGTWLVTGDKLEVKIASCKGPACKTSIGKGYSTDIHLVADRALTAKSSPDDAPFATGSYYCRYQGCEKRTGVQLISYGAKAVTMKYLVDYLIDRNRSRDVTVVWWGKKPDAATPLSAIRYCGREPERAKAGAELIAKDLAELPFVGKVVPKAAEQQDCLWDVQVTIADDAQVPSKRGATAPSPKGK